MYTLYSGRTPVDADSLDEKITDPEYDLFCQRVGYEMAWRVGRLQARVPGFKVKPASVDSAVPVETMSVGFLYPPREDVTVTISVSDPEMASVSQTTLVFTPENYSDAVDVTVAALQRSDEPDRTYEIRFATSSDDAVFDGLTDAWTFVLPVKLNQAMSITSPIKETPSRSAQTLQ
jgi:hypothetical protein